eukprot:gene22646-9100_t
MSEGDAQPLSSQKGSSKKGKSPRKEPSNKSPLKMEDLLRKGVRKLGTEPVEHKNNGYNSPIVGDTKQFRKRLDDDQKKDLESHWYVRSHRSFNLLGTQPGDRQVHTKNNLDSHTLTLSSVHIPPGRKQQIPHNLHNPNSVRPLISTLLRLWRGSMWRHSSLFETQ